MTKRVKILLFSGLAALLSGGVVCVLVVLRSQIDFPERRSFAWPQYPEEKGPTVLLGYDGPYARVAEAIRIDVRRGVPHTRIDEAPIEDVARYVTSQLEKKEEALVVVTAKTDEKFGDVVRVVDACRKTRVHGIVLNYLPLESQP